MTLINDNHFGTTHDDYLDLSKDRPYASVAEVSVGDAIRVQTPEFMCCTGTVTQVSADGNVMVRLSVFGQSFFTVAPFSKIAKVG